MAPPKSLSEHQLKKYIFLFMMAMNEVMPFCGVYKMETVNIHTHCCLRH